MLEPPPEGVEQRPVSAASRLLMGAPVALLTVRDKGVSNVLPIAWHMPLAAEPPLIAVAIEESRHSLDMIESAEEFALNFPGRTLLHHVQYLGSMTGADIDKFEATQLETFYATHVSAPLIHGCEAWIECELKDILIFGDHRLCIAEVVRVEVLPDAFSDRWRIGQEESRPLHYLGGTTYATLASVIEARMPGRSEAPERVLRERVEEELELSEEARERREERVGELERDVERGNVVDLGRELLGDLTEAAPHIDLTSGVILGPPPDDED